MTGIARDSDGNALGGVRLPEVEVRQALYIASLLDFEIAPGLPGLVGSIIDLQCAPLADGSVRFRNHGDYMNRYADQARSLREARFLLSADADAHAKFTKSFRTKYLRRFTWRVDFHRISTEQRGNSIAGNGGDRRLRRDAVPTVTS